MRTPKPWHEVFMELAHVIKKRSKDPSFQAGAVLTIGNDIISLGFNGPPPNIIDSEVPWDIRPDKYDYIYHAEENAIDYALRRIPDLQGATLYVSGHPCIGCVKKSIRWGIERIVWDDIAQSQAKCVTVEMKKAIQKLINTTYNYRPALIPYSEKLNKNG